MEGRIDTGPEPTRPEIEPIVRLCDEGRSRRLSDIQQRVDALLERGPGTVVVDMSEVDRVSSTTVAALLLVKRRCSERRVHVVLREPSQRSVNTLWRIGLLDAASLEPIATWGRTRMVLAASAGAS